MAHGHVYRRVLRPARRLARNHGHLVPPVPSRDRRISRCTILRDGPLDVRLDGSKHDEQRGQYVRVDLIAVCANIAKIKFWKYS
jgi:hypothetical protein